MNSFLHPLRRHFQDIRRRPLSYLVPVLPLLGSIAFFALLGKETNRWLDLNFTYAILWLTLVVAVSGLVLSLPWLKSALLRVRADFPAWVHLLPLVMAITATFFVAQHVEPRHRIQSDESGLLSNARSMEYLGKAGSCDEGYFSSEGLDCISLVQNFKTKSVPFFFSLIQSPEYPQGLASGVVFGTTLALLIPTAILLFLALLIYSRSPWIATVATALFLSHPTVLFQFHSASVEPWYLFFAAAAGLVFAALRQELAAGPPAANRSRWFPLAPLALIAALIAFAAQTRQESLASFGFILAPLWLHAALKRGEKTFFFAALSIFILPVLWLVYAYRGYDFQAGDNQAHGIGNLVEHARIAWNVMTTAPQAGELVVPFVAAHLWIAAFGLLYTVLQAVRREALSIRLLWFLLLALPQTLVILENVSGDMTIEINQRYSLVFIPLIALMGAQGLRVLHDGVALLPLQRARPAVQVGLLVLVCGLTWARTASYESSFERNIMYSRNHLTNEEQVIRDWYQGQAPDSARLFVYARPWHFVAYGQSAIHYRTWQNMSLQRRQQLAEQYGDEIYYVRGMDCWDRETWHPKAVEQRIGEVCDRFERSNPLQPVHRERVTGDFDVEVARLGATPLSVGGPVKLGELAITLLDRSLRLQARVIQCDPEKSLEWVLGGHRQPWDCTSGELQMDLPSTPGLAHLQLRDSDDSVVWSRVILHPAESVMPLTDLRPVFAKVGWKELQINRSVDGHVLTVDGSRYQLGLGAHAPGRVSFRLPPGYERLQSGYGLDDEEVGGDGAVFKVFGDGELLWQSGTVLHGRIELVDVDITGVERIDLVTEAGGNNHYDHTNWITPILLDTR